MSTDQLARIEILLADIVGKVGTVHTQLIDVQAKLDRVESRLDSLEARMDSLELQVADFHKEMTRFQRKTDERLEHIEHLLYRVNILERRQDNTTIRLNTIEAEVDLLAKKA